MAEHAYLYRQGPDDARRNNELDLYRESNRHNSLCAQAIDAAIDEHWNGMHVNGAAADGIIAEFGHDRVRWVLAAAVQAADWDQRYSDPNREWLKDVWIPPEVDKGRFIPHVHPAKLNDFAGLARQAYEQLHLFDAKQCDSVFDFETVAGRVLVLRPEVLKDEYKAPESMLFLASHGNGCRRDAIGRSIFGRFLVDGEQGRFYRQDFLGVLKAEFLPAWAIEKMAEPEPEQTHEPARIRVFQINRDRDNNGQCFMPLKEGHQPDSFSYDEVYNGLVPSSDLEQIYQQFNTKPPPLHRGWSLSPSDIVEVQGRYHYVNPVGFVEVEFEPLLTQKPEGLLRVVMLL